MGFDGFADPEELDALAGRVDQRADAVREDIRAFTNSVDTVPWQSDGAEGYRSQCYQVRRDLLANAAELDAAAATLRAHADAVRERIAWMHDMVAGLRHQAEEAWDEAEGAFEWTQDQARGAWETVKGWL